MALSRNKSEILDTTRQQTAPSSHPHQRDPIGVSTGVRFSLGFTGEDTAEYGEHEEEVLGHG